MKELIEKQTGLAVWVQGVVVVWGIFDDCKNGAVERENVLYTRGHNLAEMLQSLPVKLAEPKRQTVASAVESLTFAA